MSDSVRPHPWDSPGKNTGVDCHFLLQYMKVKTESEVAQSCPTLSDPMNCSLPGSSVHGIFPGKNTGMGCHCLLRLSYTYVLIYVFFHILFHYGLSQDTEYRSLCYVLGPCCLPVLYPLVRIC